MRKVLSAAGVALVIGLLVVLFVAGRDRPATAADKGSVEEELALESEQQRVSYALGFQMGKGLHSQEVPLELDILLRGVEDGLSGAKPLMNDQEMLAEIEAFREKVTALQQQKRQEAARENKQRAEEFLAANKEKEGVKELPEGVQYKVLEKGTGDSPEPTDRVVAHYTGKLLDGKVFDSSRRRGQPATFGLAQVIPGWRQAVSEMKVGGKWRVFVPPEQGYGARGVPPAIGPNQLLIFEIELLEIKEPAEEKEPTAESPEASGEAAPGGAAP